MKENKAGEKRLVAYLVGDAESGLDANEVRRYLKDKLPEYMVPGVFVKLERMPLTPSGKLDRRSLPMPAPSAIETGDDFVRPRTPVEEILAGIWTDLLEATNIGVDSNFFDLGGHSLLATRLISRVRETFQVDLPLRSVFESPTIGGLAATVEQAMRENWRIASPPFRSISRDQELPLSFAQQRLWFIDQLQPGTSLYNVPKAIRFSGLLNVEALERCISEIIRRHEVLRTTFASVQGLPAQVIREARSIQLAILDLGSIPESERETEARRLAKEEAEAPFDLAIGPLLRVKLLRLAPEDHIVLLTMHHIISDGWSTSLLVQEVTVLYDAFTKGEPSPLQELSFQYADYAAWQRELLQGDVLDEQLSYWKRKLGGQLPVLQIPTDRPRPAVPNHRGAQESCRLDQELSDQLKELSRREGVTLFMTLVATFKLLLARYCEQNDIVIGTNIANRNRAETETLIGFLVNMLVLRTDLSGCASFRELLGRVRDVTLGAYAHQDLPFERLVEELQPERHLSRNPLFQVLFALQNAPRARLDLPALKLSQLEGEDIKSRFDLSLFVIEAGDGLVMTWRYSTDLFDAETIQLMSERFVTLVRAILAQPDAPLDQLEIRSEAERNEQLLESRKLKESKFKKFKTASPKPVSLLPAELVSRSYLFHADSMPLVMSPSVKELDLVEWALQNGESIEQDLLKHGAILFREFRIGSAVEFQKFAHALCPQLSGEYGDLPREGVSEKVYGSTPYPADKNILFHNEGSHTHRWPQKIFFHCVIPAQDGGETPIVNCRQVYRGLDPRLRELFAEKQLLYVRNFTDRLDVRWQDFFRTDDKEKVEKLCRESSIVCEWKNGNGLRIRQRCRAITTHPKTGDSVFFNQILLHHISSLDPSVSASLLSLFSEEDLPRNVYFGDGSPIDPAIVEAVADVLWRTSVKFPWQEGDVLLLDNMLTAHARMAYVGARKILVAMGEMLTDESAGLRFEEIGCGQR